MKYIKDFFLYLIGFGGVALYCLAFLWIVAGDPTPLAPYKPIHPYAAYRGLEFVNKARVPSASEIDSVIDHARQVLGLDNSYVKKEE